MKKVWGYFGGTRTNVPLPARLVTGLITERDICAASADSILATYPEKKQ